MNHFTILGLSTPLIQALAELGYETPTPIQAKGIPVLLEGKDLLGQAQTGTGKTAAFALPLLDQIDFSQNSPQALILTPTRELSLQVATAFTNYGKHLHHVRVLAIYGGQHYREQLQALKRGVHIVVGTPGRIMDHLRRGSLQLTQLKHMVLDEADEMLNMGFIDDVKWILEQIPTKHQRALFSATLPDSIRAIVKQYLDNPVKITIKPENAKNNVNISQSYVVLPNHQKTEALIRFLAVENRDGAIIFTRTRLTSTDLAEKLGNQGFRVAALNGDMQQTQRELVMDRIKKNQLDILIATDVAARGIDIQRISHVFNYDMPGDIESYTHRIGRTGRAGRSGKAILFVTPNEKRMLNAIRRMSPHSLEETKIPGDHDIKKIQKERDIKQIVSILENPECDLKEFRKFVSHKTLSSYESIDIAAALLYLQQQSKIQVETKPLQEPIAKQTDADMISCRVNLGHRHGIKPGELVGMIANKSNIHSKNIGAIKIHNDHTFIDLKNTIVNKVITATNGIKLKKGTFRLAINN